MRVLVVDDNADIVLTTVELLKAIGHESMGCYNGMEAVECVRDYDPDVVITDIAMPAKNGWQAAQEIRAERGRRCPVLIAVSGQYTKGRGQGTFPDKRLRLPPREADRPQDAHRSAAKGGPV